MTTGAGNTDTSCSDKPIAWQYEILTLSFNQDCTSLAMGTLNSYNLFTINQEDRPEEIHDCACDEVCIIERLFSSSLIAIVTRRAPRKLKVCHFKRGSEICAYSFANDIRGVKLNRSRLVVCLEDSIYIHNMRDMKLLHTMREVSVNPDGLCDLSSNDANPYLAYPASSITGEIQIFDTVKLQPTIVISAHESPLVAMVFDASGTRIATASNKGTIIRVHSAIDGSRLFEFRRGLRRVATIYSLAFSPDSMFLVASSSTETIHIFRLMDSKDKAPEEPNTWIGSFSRLLGDVAYYLPKQTSEALTQDRAFASVHLLQSSTAKTIVAMNIFNKVLRLFVAGYDGIVHIYEVNTTEGGECKQISQHALFSKSPNAMNPSAMSSEARNSVHGSPSVYPPNVLRTNDKTHPLSSTLINEKHCPSQTALDEQSFAPLPVPSMDN